TNYGVYLDAMGRLEESLAEAYIAQQLDPVYATTASNIGSLSCKLGQYKRGIVAVNDALALDPNFMPARWELARCYLQQKIYPEAIAVLKEARSLRISSSRILGLLAYAYAVLGNRDDAFRIVEELKSAAETDADALIGIAHVFVGLD